MRQCVTSCFYIFPFYILLILPDLTFSPINHGRHGYEQPRLDFTQYELLIELYEHGYGIQKCPRHAAFLQCLDPFILG